MGELLGLLDAFGDDAQAQVLPDVDNRLDHDATLICVVAAELADERPVDLEEVDGERAQVRE